MGITGIIRPPPDIRAVADRTALFVSKNGRAFEIKILNSEKGKTPKFAFLQATSPFHAYYEDRIRFYDEGGTDEEEKKKEEEERARKRTEEQERERKEIKEKEEAEAAAARKEAARKKASAVDPVARALLAGRARIEDAKRAAAKSRGDGGGGEGEGERDENDVSTTASPAGPRPPPDLHHVSLMSPANLTPLEVEVIKLTAQYVALSKHKDAIASPRADNFLSNLTLKEWSNPEFAFLQPRHAHFAYFTALVDSYRSFLPGGVDFEIAKKKVWMDAKRERLAHLIHDDSHKVNVAKKDAARECLEAAAYRAEYERDAVERRRDALEGSDVLFGGAGTIDWHDFVIVETIDFAVDEVVEALLPPTSLRLAALNKEKPALDKMGEKEEEDTEEEEEEMDVSTSEEDVDMEGEENEGGEKLKVVSNYEPKVVSTKEITGDASRTHVIDPITGKSIAVANMPEHMRIQLMDPKWAEERRRFLEKQRETNFVAGEDIASNISRFAQARGDIFGSSDADVRDQRADSERRLMEANRLIREQAMQPQQQPQTQVRPPPPPSQVATPPSSTPTSAVPPLPPRLGGPGVPPPPNPESHPTQQSGFAPFPPPGAPPPPPFPPPPEAVQTMNSVEERALKRPKTGDSVVDPTMAAVPTVPPSAVPAARVPPRMTPASQRAPTAHTATISESDFIATLSNPNEVPICVRIPHDPSNSGWNLNGQTLDVTVKAETTIKDLKGMLKVELGGMPLNKMQLRHPILGFMNRDGLSMAHFNVGPMSTLDLVPKTRGGRK